LVPGTSLDRLELERLLQSAADIAENAGRDIIEVYQRPNLEVQVKGDDSPLTEADLAAHRRIVAGLSALTPSLPILSEESASTVNTRDRLQWQRYWLVDPLDGTKEFIKRNGEFTVNIALIDNHVPVLGIVHVPAQNLTYSGASGLGAWRSNCETRAVIQVTDAHSPPRLVGSRSHAGPHLESYAQSLGAGELVARGSSLKFCLIAEGSADVYPRFGPTCEWDTAAAQAVVTGAGGRVVDLRGEDLLCNRGESLLNPYFIVYGDSKIDWLAPLNAELLEEASQSRG